MLPWITDGLWGLLSLSEKSIVEHDGKRWNRTVLPSGAIIESEIVEPHDNPVEDSEELKILKKIAKKLGVPDE